MNKEVENLLKRVASVPGWTVERKPKGHVRIKGPDRQLIHTGRTPSDRRSILNFRAQLRRDGFFLDEDQR